MKCAKDYRSEALYALDGRWKLAVLAYFIASLFGVSYSVSTRIEIHLDKIESPSFAIALLLVALALVLISAIVKVGYIRFNLDLHLRQPKLGTLFSFFPHWGKAIGASLLVGLYTLLWSLLLFVPGIIASYSYAMVPYILADHPDYSVDEAIEASKDIMSGNRWRLFCLDISFIGWDLLCILTLGIGNLWLGPYRAAAFAAFYWDISPRLGPSSVSPENGPLFVENP